VKIAKKNQILIPFNDFLEIKDKLNRTAVDLSKKAGGYELVTKFLRYGHPD